MPNRFQVVYVASFVATTLFLVVLTEFVKAQLHARGIYVSDLILLGTGKKPIRPPTDVRMFTDSYTQLIALAFALVTGAIMFMKFGSAGSTCSPSVCVMCIRMLMCVASCRAQAGAGPSGMEGVPPHAEDRGLPQRRDVSSSLHLHALHAHSVPAPP